ncbi:hypothetical protein CO709_30325 [Burkholderia thailandensis]|nr:hypothetical protein CO709_30325 [Burkholderia thailandensis]
MTPARRVRLMSDAARDTPRVRHRISACTVFEPRNAAELSSFHAIACAGGVRCGAARSRRRAPRSCAWPQACVRAQYARRGATYAPYAGPTPPALAGIR